MPTLKIDGREVTVADGTNLVEAARALGVEIPTFCYHKDLSIAANCRMCLVKGTQNGRAWPKPMPACQMVAAEGMEIDASSDEVKRLRRAMLEFILINHPLDCPICDKAGECTLQNNYFAHSNQPSRFKEVKEEKLKRGDLGPRILYDGERCITCTRCVRFMDEVARDPQLGVIQRGDRALIATAHGASFDHPYSVNTVDICPVGALTDKEFRFQQRAWFLRATPSVCPGCARGCNVFVDTSTVDQQVYRIRPRDNPAVNGAWMCDEGRLSINEVHAGRLLTPRADGKATDLARAVQSAVDKLKPLFGADELAVAIAPTVSCEDAYAIASLCKELLDVDKVAITGRREWVGDNFLRLPDHNPNRRGLLEIFKALELSTFDAPELLASIEKGETQALLVVGNAWPVDDMDRVAGAVSKLVTSVALVTHDDAVARAATVAIPITGFAETASAMVNALGRVQRLGAAVGPQGGARPAWEVATLLARAAELPLRFKTHEQLWSQLGEQVELLKGLNLDAIGVQGVARGGETRAPRFAGDKVD